ncbi:hypothetical protein L484_022521 [Morus notabilis]|uniref:Uncharacterized protein n=1 Tax=Morus notabilis TaxID=981085 RepID=W9QUT8_9ROSA|nr:hypothetical protein L484_022521 [Morus notabilis]
MGFSPFLNLHFHMILMLEEELSGKTEELPGKALAIGTCKVTFEAYDDCAQKKCKSLPLQGEGLGLCLLKDYCASTVSDTRNKF